jgi:hypothetical protein
MRECAALLGGHPVDALVEDMIAQHIPNAGAEKKRATQSGPPAPRRAVLRRDTLAPSPAPATIAIFTNTHVKRVTDRRR